jgi:hypothetical protein
LTATGLSFSSLLGYTFSGIISDDSFKTSVVSGSSLSVFCFIFFATATGLSASLGFSVRVYFFVSSLGGS